jgi:hypothetical protein
MKRVLLGVLAATLLAAPSAAALDRDQARVLLRTAVKLSGLQARAQPRIVVESRTRFRQRRVKLLDRDYPHVAQEYDETVYRALGLVTGGNGVLRRTLIELEDRTGLYDPVSRTAYIQAGAGESKTALHELVHALQDQHFDLRRAMRLPGGSDGRVAAEAAIEGHATLVAGVPSSGKTSSRSGGKLARFVELERGFRYSVGLRFAADLRNLGGTKAVLTSLRRFPATTEQVFHLDAYLERERALPIVLPESAAGATLAGHSTFGELDVRALLAVFGVPRLAQVGTGWGGGRTAVYRGAGGDTVLIALEWDTEQDAQQWAEAVHVYVDQAFDADEPGPPEPTPCTVTACWNLAGHAVALHRLGARTAVALGADLDSSTQVARRVLRRTA